jgi:hypothetical protein
MSTPPQTIQLSPTAGYAIAGFAGVVVVSLIGLGFYQTYATMQLYSQGSQDAKDQALTRLATGEAVALGAHGIGEGYAATQRQGGRRKTHGKLKKSRKTRRRNK